MNELVIWVGLDTPLVIRLWWCKDVSRRLHGYNCTIHFIEQKDAKKYAQLCVDMFARVGNPAGAEGYFNL
jgi:hypothetical protein